MMVAGGLISLLIVTMPPRHGKSELISKYFPAWYLGRFPRNRIILSSYEANFASEWGGKARDVLDANRHWFGVSLSRRASRRWTIGIYGGGMQTAGVGGAITGKGANIFIIDDPVKGEGDALSEVKRKRAWDWYQATASTRLEPRGGMIVVMTRWNEEDLVGKLIESRKATGLPYVHLNFPAICEDDTLEMEKVIGRKNGDPLWAYRYPLEGPNGLLAMKKEKHPYWWNALFQQRPAPLEGNFVKKSWFRYFVMETIGGRPYVVLKRPEGARRIPVSALTVFFTVDLAASLRTTADYTVVSIWGLVPDSHELIWLDCIGERMEGPDQTKLIVKQYETYDPALIGIEATAYQLTMVQNLLREGLPVHKLTADKDKVSRFLPMGTMYENGRVYHPLHASWLGTVEDQLVKFPNAGHDDYVDTASYAARMLHILTGLGTMEVTGY